MYEELVKRLRADSFVCNSCIEKRRCKNEDHICVLKNQLQAAKAIEKLEAKNKELESKIHDSFTEHLLNQISRKEKQIEDLKATCKKECEARQRQADIIQDLKGTIYQQISKIDELKVEKSKLEKELEQVKAERDAVINDLKKYVACKTCANFEQCFIECNFKPCEHAQWWQWRGVQGGKGND